MGIITGAGIQGVFMSNGGFLRLPNDLPKPFWRYPIYYIAFHRYANEGFYRNEFEGLSFPNNQVLGGSSSSTIRGEEILKNIWQLPMGYSKWVLYRLIFLVLLRCLKSLNPF
ncbi:hypothetical protein MKW92_011485 [Papaver armeniacum]|nr:hypothetical protein MKW92_011485 [Papaver armeniacum]